MRLRVVRSSLGEAQAEVGRLPFFLGVFPFRYTRATFRLSHPCLAFSLLYLAAMTGLALVVLASPSSFYLVNRLVHLVYVGQHLSIRVALLTNILWLVWNRDLLNRMLTLFSHVDLFLMSQGESLTYEINYLEEVSFVIYFCGLATTHVVNRESDVKTYLKAATYYCSCLSLYACACQFRRAVRLLSCGFASLTACLGTRNRHRLEDLLTTFDNLYLASACLNRLFGPQNLLVAFNTFLLCTANSYFIYQSFLLREVEWENVIRLGWLLTFALIGNQIVSPCAAIAKQAKEFNILLYQLMIDDKTNEMPKNKKLRLHIAMKREIVFTACGFFTLDYRLVHSMIAAATTYLVILIQFGQPASQIMSTANEESNTTIPLNLPNDSTTVGY